ncbi:methyltransferase [Geminicoccus flavidas]|uniref:methyltransferase n=1 Tax=Geminicoccus flavidas TaxID=2506407 RepID=UPI001356994F|nr:methyltransferase [Geminicoccus flavidas]
MLEGAGSGAAFPVVPASVRGDEEDDQAMTAGSPTGRGSSTAGHGSEGGPAPVQPDTIRRLQAGVAPAMALLAGMQLRVFTRLDAGPATARELATALDVDPGRLPRLLRALVAIGLLEETDGRFRNTAEAAAFLVEGRPSHLGGQELLAQLWHADLQTAQSIRSGQPAAMHDFAGASDEAMLAMLRGMHPLAVAAGQDLARRLDLTGVRSVIDIGGGSGGLAAALCALEPERRATLFELPRNARLAAALLQATPGGARVTIEAGDILAAPPSGSYDLAVLRALVQVLGPDEAGLAIRHAAAAVRPGGTVVIIGGGILDDDRQGPPSAVLLDLTLMNLYPAGAAYTEAEHAAWLASAGCHDLRRIVLPTGSSIIVARKAPQKHAPSEA